jgi:hypothetical protein
MSRDEKNGIKAFDFLMATVYNLFIESTNLMLKEVDH